MSIDILCFTAVPQDRAAGLAAHGFALHSAIPPEERLPAARALADRVRVVLTGGRIGITAELIDALPRLELICTPGAGYEKVDVAAARARGIVVTHGPGANAVSVADHAMALLLSVAREIVTSDAAARGGAWGKTRHLRGSITGRRLGILGLGTIGLEIARRGAGGFAMPVAYHNRRPRDDVPYPFHGSVEALARESDFLVVATPGGAGTQHLVDAAVLRALGPEGYLVNIGRGSVVDTAALIDALRTGTIAGAGLDVVDGEPEVPPALAALPNLVLTPHIAARSREAVAAMDRLLLENLQAHFAGRPVVTPVAG